ncbi:MAG: class I SAM-dependent DNA methyltransferase [Ignavibacteriales bacterium]|nr:class I SAM-dependent DNA methyltransferase [Ignavibacteriales bacterium]
MDNSQHNKIVSFIWSIADDCLRDVFVRGKYRDVILPMFVLRRIDVLLEPTKEAIKEEVKYQREDVGLTELDPNALQDVTGYVFYNTSKFTLKSMLGNPSQIEANFKNYLDGFSDNVKEIIDKFYLRAQIRKMVDANVLHDVIEKYTSNEINLGPETIQAPDEKTLPGLSNHGMGIVFEELIRKFNEENNEEAGEHFTPREVIHLMTHLLFLPVKKKLPPVIMIYDPACGSGGMLTESENYLTDPDGPFKVKEDRINLYGKEVNGETYAICKSDMMIKGKDPAHIKFGSTLATDDFSSLRFDFMLSNPPYGKSWKADQKNIIDEGEVIDPRFQISLKNFRDEWELVNATPRSSDGQLLFLMEMVNKMKRLSDSPLGSRIASIHNGSSLFTGDAGSGESNIRRYIIENDWLEAIIQLPNNLFYNTGITTYIWIVSNNKAKNRKGKVQLIDASNMFEKLRNNLGQKNCRFSDAHIDEITEISLEMPNSGVSKVFDNSDFGYYKVTVERPLRLKSQFTNERISTLRFVSYLSDIMQWIYSKYGDKVYDGLKKFHKEIEEHISEEQLDIPSKNIRSILDVKVWEKQLRLMDVAKLLQKEIGTKCYNNFNIFQQLVTDAIKKLEITLTSSEKKQILDAVSWRDENAESVIKSVHALKDEKLNEILNQLGTTKERLNDYGFWQTKHQHEFIEYEPDSELRDNENIPLKEDIYKYFIREVRPHVGDAWMAIDKTQIGYEVSFNKYFYKHTPLRSLEKVTKEILALEKETKGLLKKIVGFRKVR